MIVQDFRDEQNVHALAAATTCCVLSSVKFDYGDQKQLPDLELQFFNLAGGIQIPSLPAGLAPSSGSLPSAAIASS